MTKIIILAGGWGTRLGRQTEVIPKPMVRIGDKPVLLVFFTGNCPGCAKVAPSISRINQQKRDQVAVVGVFTPQSQQQNSRQFIKMALLKYQIKYPVLLDSQASYKDNYNLENEKNFKLKKK